MAINILYGFIFLIFFKAVEGDYCLNGKYCDWGCCGSYCCSYSSYYDNDRDHQNVIKIIGAVVGSAVCMLFVASVIVVVCCCCRKSRGQAGQVFHTTYLPVAVNGGLVPNSGYRQVGCVTGAVSGQIQKASVQPGAPET